MACEGLHLRIPIRATVRSDGEGRTRNVTAGQVHRTDVMNHEDEYFHTNITMSACVHGVWDEGRDDNTPTTFLLFTCEIQSMYQFRAKKIKLQIHFLNADNVIEGSSPANPDIVSRGPAIIDFHNRTTVHRRREQEVRFASQGPAMFNPGIALHHVSTKEYDKQYFGVAKSGVRHASPTEQRYVKVWWIYEENPLDHEGVPPAFRIGVLLKRQNESPFQAQFSIAEFDAGWRHHLSSKWRHFFSKPDPGNEADRVIDPIIFDPTVPGPALPHWLSGVNPTQLASLHTDNGIEARYARVWGVEP